MDTIMQNSSQRGMAMIFALISAILLSPLYVHRKNEYRSYETRWSSGFVLPVVLVGLIVAIKTTSSSSSSSSSVQRWNNRSGSNLFRSDPEASSASSVLRIGNSSWGLAGVLLLLICVLSWQSSLQQLLWR
ncbi:hypothetical protein M9H77_15253 [Catharanthus roseus]|uniref:Uncharacterized protein n=1 Tax=Catharanthus roseus TaxID=4058 RepID=A0ACC0AYH4_CATRO|nr:hypothetical protein M9H77_15253 [Catharanthus roseus]